MKNEKEMTNQELADALSAAADTTPAQSELPLGAQAAPRDGTFLKLLVEVLKRLLLSGL